MARTLNNEVDVLNIASLDNDIKDSFTRAMITEDVNTTSAAARRYLKGEYFIHTDRYLYKALEDIAAGTTITPDANAEVVTVSEELVRLFAQSPEGIFEILSNIENTSVASKNYVKGSQFIWTDKKLYEATADIASGSTFVIGTNIKLADNLTSQIQTLTNNDDAMLNVLGAKNVGAFNFITQTKTAGIPITFTANTDGTVVVSGTGTAEYVNIYCNFELKKGSYILSGCPEGGGVATYALSLVLRGTTPQVVLGGDFGEGAAFTLSEDATVGAFIELFGGYTFSGNLVFKPMIRPASIEDDTYVPHAMTNKELTDLATVVKGAITPATGVTVTSLFVEKYGKVVIINGYIIANVPSGSSTNLFIMGTIEDGFRPKATVRTTAGVAEHAYDVPTHFAYLVITTDGEIQLKTARTGASAVYFSLSYTTN